jgi:hypothetical protein
MKRCTGCGATDDKPLGLNKNGEPYLACCPDSSYFEMTAMQKHLDWLKGRMIVSPQMENQLLEEEKQQIIDAYIDGYCADENNVDSQKYYNQIYKQD